MSGKMPVNGLVNHPTPGDFGQNGVSFKLAHVKCHNRVGYKARKILKRCFLSGYKRYGFGGYRGGYYRYARGPRGTNYKRKNYYYHY